ncbi:RNA polymerase sigma factor [Streptomyces sp. NBC_00151]|uniref:RNA polymerase sigma factor n=1 Tax=Streptomyces sp. NBC_00151 TaxID=2975669 RepID=UPI002DDC734A|nr:sigma-70 family RNA polymerase sigma factor [Streptomyces sp. NBC_00151]WRZ44602.1 sigma-70 family RNA polymerase sigma factor [Streptomyces sp. NBC_00151]
MAQRIPSEYVDEVAEFFEREQGTLVRYARCLTNSQETAEDLAQLAFMEAALKWGMVRDLGLVPRRGWLRQVCCNKWVDELRRGRFRQLYGALAVPEEDLRPDPAAQIEARTALEAAQAAMEQLPRQRRAIAQLYWLAGYSTSEIAALLGVAPSGVRKHIALAGRAIRAAVEPLGDGEFVPLVPHLIKLLDQLFFEFVQFRAARGDPFRDLGLRHEAESKWRRGRGAEETAKSSPDTPSDDEDRRLSLTASVSTPHTPHASPSDQHVRSWRRFWVCPRSGSRRHGSRGTRSRPDGV